MKTLVTLLVCALTLAVATLAATSTGKAAEKKKTQLRHVVAFKFKADTAPAKIQEVETAFAALKTAIPQIQGFECGINNSPENLNKGCTHGFILSFKTEQDRDAYLVHPEHKKFGGLVGPILDDVFVIDFWVD
jgi:hypothetical protein